MPIRVLLAEDERILRDALATLLAREPDMVVVGHTANGVDAVQLALQKRPDVLVLDIGLPGLDGIAVARTLRERLSGTRIVALSMHQNRRYVRGMLDAGAAAYVDKSSALDELVRAIRAVMGGKLYLSPNVTRSALGASVGAGQGAAVTAREREVLARLAEGQRSAQIARDLGIATATVEVHRRNIMRKLQLHSVAELTRYAVREGLVLP